MEEKEIIEDLKISNFVFSRYFSVYKHLKDDLVQESLFALWNARKNFNPNISTYITYACNVSKNAMKMLIRKEERHLNNADIEEFQEILKITPKFEDYVSTMQDIEKLKRLNKKYPKVINLLLAGFNHKEIAQKLNFTRQYVDKVIMEMKINFSNLTSN